MWKRPEKNDIVESHNEFDTPGEHKRSGVCRAVQEGDVVCKTSSGQAELLPKRIAAKLHDSGFEVLPTGEQAFMVPLL